MRTVVINNREGLEQLQMPHLGKDSSGQPLIGECITLLPGVNLVDSKKLAELLKNPAIARKFKDTIPESRAPEQTPEKVGKPILEIDKTIGTKGEVPDKSPLATLPEQQCESLISDTLVTSMLNEWLEEETRGEVRKMLYRQIEKLMGNPANPATAGR